MHDPTDYEARHILGEPEEQMHAKQQELDEMKISSHLPDIVDNYISIRAQRLVLDRQAKELKEAEEDLKRTIVAKFQENGMKALGGSNGLVKMTELDEPVATDWPALYEYIEENNAFHLLHKRIATLAVKELWDDGRDVPGVGHAKVYKLSVSGMK